MIYIMKSNRKNTISGHGFIVKKNFGSAKTKAKKKLGEGNFLGHKLRVNNFGQQKIKGQKFYVFEIQLYRK